jgi:hypothetical protein
VSQQVSYHTLKQSDFDIQVNVKHLMQVYEATASG